MITCNQQPLTLALSEVPVLPAAQALEEIATFLRGSHTRHMLHVVTVPVETQIQVIAILADDHGGTVSITSFLTHSGEVLPSIAPSLAQMHIFERDVWERHGVIFEGNQWLKPVRFPVNASHKKGIDDYPFFRIGGGEIHEVGVGPIHAGVIEPGHFRFQCTGEDVVHLEIMLGYQHRDVEGEMVRSNNPNKRNVIVESIAGDTTIGHAWAHAMVVEKLREITYDSVTERERAIALELERIAIHVGDLGALSLDVAWQLGSAYFGALRTPLINFFQHWCGNRFGKGLIRPGMNRFRLNATLRSQMRDMLDEVDKKFTELANKMFDLPSVITRFEKTGIVTHEQVCSIGAVGMSARMSGLSRDIRKSHPHGAYQNLGIATSVEHTGDVLARAKIRRREVDVSMKFIRALLDELDALGDISDGARVAVPLAAMAPNAIAVAVVEAWRGELVHVGITDGNGDFATYRVKDPSLHNWFVLALSVRNNEISDFPICNKSFDLSYCGHDL